LDFFRWIPVNFLWLSTGTGRKTSEKNPKNFQLEYYFHVLAIFGAFLPELARNF
jgi:hypothetical protein